MKLGDRVYASDWCYGVIIGINDEGAVVEFETSRGGGGGKLLFLLR